MNLKSKLCLVLVLLTGGDLYGANAAEARKIIEEHREQVYSDKLIKLKKYEEEVLYSKDDLFFRKIFLVDKTLKTEPLSAYSYIKSIDKSSLTEKYHKNVVDIYTNYLLTGIDVGKVDKDFLEKAIRDRLLASKWRSLSLVALLKASESKKDLRKHENLIKKYGVSSILDHADEADIKWLIKKYDGLGPNLVSFNLRKYLSKDFPLKESAVEAVEKLISMHIDENFPLKLDQSFLSHIARLSLEHHNDKWKVIASLVDGEFNMRGKVRKLDDIEKLEYLLAIRAYEDIYNHSVYEEGNLAKQTEKDTKQLLIIRARAYFRSGLYQESIKAFEEFITLFPSTYERHFSNIAIADAYKNLGQFQKAHEKYSQVKHPAFSKYATWQSFWMLYKSGDFDNALEFISRSRRITKDKSFQHGGQFWRSKISKKLNQMDKAREIDMYIVDKNPNGFYSTIVLAENRDILDLKIDKIEKMGVDINEPDEEDGLDALPVEDSFTLYDSDFDIFEGEGSERFSMSSGFYQVGLVTEAIDLINMIPKTAKNEYSGELFADLSLKLENYPDVSKWRSSSRSYRGRFKNFASMIEDMNKDFNQWSDDYPIVYKSNVVDISKRLGVDPLFVLSVMRAESRYSMFAKSPVGARGLLQLMPYTAMKVAEEIGDDHFSNELNLYDPASNITYGVYYLSKLLEAFEGNFYLALAAYNAGPKNVKTWLDKCSNCSTVEFIEDIPFKETRKYVKKITGYYTQYQRIYRGRLVPEYSDRLPSVSDSISEMY